MSIRLIPAMLALLMASGSAFSAGEPEPAAAAGPDPRVKIETNLGSIIVELNPEKAPVTVENFLNYIKEDGYRNSIFHRVISGFMAQGGGFTPDYQRLPTNAPIKIEADNGLKNDKGTIAMARTGVPDSATRQFFINLVDNKFLNHTSPDPRGWGYTVFGKVVEGMDVVERMANIPTGSGGQFRTDVPQETVTIKEITVIGGDAGKAGAKK